MNSENNDDKSEFELTLKVNSANFDYKEEMQIDADALDVEWLYQPQLYTKYAEAAVLAELKYERAKERLEFVKADLDNEIRSNPILYTQSDKKLTEGRITSLILTDERYKNALTFFNKAKKQYKIIGIALKALDQRKAALENLVRLHGQHYFASPSVVFNDEEGNEVNSLSIRAEATRKKVQDRIKEKLNPSKE